MKKNIYGNIEDLLVRVKIVTPRGTMERIFLVREKEGGRGREEGGRKGGRREGGGSK